MKYCENCHDMEKCEMYGGCWNPPAKEKPLCPSDATACSPVLCYVDGQWAYFTTKKLSEQWGDDWNDAPYEHNAGEPYTYGDHDRKEGSKPWEIVKVAWDGDFETPCTDQFNSRWSVDRINAGGVAWMQTSRWRSGEAVIIPAGTTLSDFCRLIAAGGGKVYLENDQSPDAGATETKP